MTFEPAGSDADLRREYLELRVQSRRDAGDRIMRRVCASLPRLKHAKARQKAEQDARSALAAYRGSLDWAEDTDLEEEAHRALDDAGRWVRETFGCFLDRSGRTYNQTCPVELAHNRVGLSIGGQAASRVCSLCGEDVSECEHLPGTAYVVPGGSEDLGWCRVCCEEECDHLPTEHYRASVVSKISEMEFVEVSLVSKPAHPEARIGMIPVPVADLVAELGDDFEPGMEVSCDRCLTRCEGLMRRQLPHG